MTETRVSENKRKYSRHTLIKLNIPDIVEADYNLTISNLQEYKNGFITKQGDSLLFDQIRLARGCDSRRIDELILVLAKKAPRTKQALEKILREGFHYNGRHYVRFGKSASQGKEGVTVFIDADYYDRLMSATLLDMEIDKCVISKFEAQRCLVFSSCTLIDGLSPNIVIIDEFEKVIPDQLIRYVAEHEEIFTDPATGKQRKYKRHVVEEGVRDIPISPFDGSGCHDIAVGKAVQEKLGKKYRPAGLQVRLPFMKGFSVEFPFKEWFAERGIETITDAFGQVHKVQDIDCIWNTTMFKGYKLFKAKYGADGWRKYCEKLDKYGYVLGVSKFSHHTDNLNMMTRLNFQYLQCLNLSNPIYKQTFDQNQKPMYDILDPANDGKIIKLAKYSTDLCERIIGGSKIDVLLAMGIKDTERGAINNKLIEACLINDDMFEDVAVKSHLKRQLKKFIHEMKLGKIYAHGFYHTVVGDIIGYLEFAAGLPVVGSLKAKQFFAKTMECGEGADGKSMLSMRSPLVCPSEVNDIHLVNAGFEHGRWFEQWDNQDICMINMYDISAPQQGGMDTDGDVVYLTDEPILVENKIHKPIIVDIEDKVTVSEKEYTTDNLVDYEMNSRDSRIGELTNIASSILNKTHMDEEWQQTYDDDVSLLRIYQGKEIDFLKTGVRWQLSSRLRAHLKRLPYFLMFNYEDKLKRFYKIRAQNQNPDSEKIPLNCFFSSSPMNELCEYINTWELRKVLWDNRCKPTRHLIIDNSLDYQDKDLIRDVRMALNTYNTNLREWRKKYWDSKGTGSGSYLLNNANFYDQWEIYEEKQYEELVLKLHKLPYSQHIIANYVIYECYRNTQTKKTIAWKYAGDTIIENLKANTPPDKQGVKVVRVDKPTEHSVEYLGKHYEMISAAEDEIREVGCENGL